MKKISIFLLNEVEGFQLTGEKETEAIIANLRELFPHARVMLTLGKDGAVYADKFGDKGYCPARKVEVKDTTGAGDSFCAGVSIGLTYGKTLREACEIGSMLAASVIVTTESVCPRFLPRELGLDIDVVD